MSDLHDTTRRLLDALEAQHRLALKHAAWLNNTQAVDSPEFRGALKAESLAYEETHAAMNAWALAGYPGVAT